MHLPQMVAGNAHVDVEPLYGPTYLPRKFKIAIAIPPQNDGMYTRQGPRTS
jgi:sulfite reductase (NADPH) hemoprotein beta-component